MAPFFATESKSDSIRGSFFCSSNQNRPFYFRVLSSTGFFVENFVMIFFSSKNDLQQKIGRGTLCFRVTEFYRVFQDGNATGRSVLEVTTLPSFTEFYRVLPSFLFSSVVFLRDVAVIYRVLPSFTEFYRVFCFHLWCFYGTSP